MYSPWAHNQLFPIKNFEAVDNINFAIRLDFIQIHCNSLCIWLGHTIYLCIKGWDLSLLGNKMIALISCEINISAVRYISFVTTFWQFFGQLQIYFDFDTFWHFFDNFLTIILSLFFYLSTGKLTLGALNLVSLYSGILCILVFFQLSVKGKKNDF